MADEDEERVDLMGLVSRANALRHTLKDTQEMVDEESEGLLRLADKALRTERDSSVKDALESFKRGVHKLRKGFGL